MKKCTTKIHNSIDNNDQIFLRKLSLCMFFELFCKRSLFSKTICNKSVCLNNQVLMNTNPYLEHGSLVGCLPGILAHSFSETEIEILKDPFEIRSNTIESCHLKSMS